MFTVNSNESVHSCSEHTTTTVLPCIWVQQSIVTSIKQLCRQRLRVYKFSNPIKVHCSFPYFQKFSNFSPTRSTKALIYKSLCLQSHTQCFSLFLIATGICFQRRLIYNTRIRHAVFSKSIKRKVCWRERIARERERWLTSQELCMYCCEL